MYRRSGQFDFLRDYLPPSITEFRKIVEKTSWFDLAANPVIFSTMGDGRIVRGLAGVPNEGPVLLVGNHMLMGLELYPLYKFFLSERNIIIRALAHSLFFSRKQERKEYHDFDIFSFLGAVPVSAANIFKLLSSNSYVLLYPGGVREGLRRKGEEYKLFWPKKPEFVRMAACFEATIVPFSVVGEDDILELVLDYDDQMRIPFTKSFIEEVNEGAVRIRPKTDEEVSNQDLYLPGVLPKLPGRLYCLLGKPIQTRGRKAALNNRETANELYLQIKSEIENSISYLQRKREEDPYRGIIQRTIYRASRGSSQHIPTFEP